MPVIESPWRRPTLRGIARVLTFEHPELKTDHRRRRRRRQRVGHCADRRNCSPIADHDEVALRDGQRYVNRLVPAPTTRRR